MINTKPAIDYERLLHLNNRVKEGTSTRQEQDELMKLLYDNESITEKQYNDYRRGQNVQDILGAALIIAGIVLLGHVIHAITAE
ncbi:MAG: hypothetical protein AAGC88_08980 [Bacteroidota bacterium]